MLLEIILGLFIAEAKADIIEVLYNQTLNEDQLREKIPEPTITLLKPRGFTVTIPGFLEENIAAIDLTGGINLYPPDAGKIFNLSYPISQEFLKTNASNWFSEIKDVEVKAGDKIELVVRVFFANGPFFEDATKYCCYDVTDNEIKKLSDE